MTLTTPLDKVIKALRLEALFTPEATNKISRIAARWNLVRTLPSFPLSLELRLLPGVGLPRA